MGLYANYTNGKLTISSEPIVINSITYDPKIHKEDVKGFKWFRTRGEAYKYFKRK